jgi:hypothetical protein
LAGRECIIGHKDLANILGVECRRKSIVLNPGDSILVAQVMGGRLPEGTKILPEGFSLKWFEVYVEIPRKPWTTEYGIGSTYGAIHQKAEEIAGDFPGATVSDMADQHENYFAIIKGPGIYAELYDG